jgi:hypothetical protein
MCMCERETRSPSHTFRDEGGMMIQRFYFLGVAIYPIWSTICFLRNDFLLSKSYGDRIQKTSLTFNRAYSVWVIKETQI